MSALCYRAPSRSSRAAKPARNPRGALAPSSPVRARIDGIKRQLDADWGGAELPRKRAAALGERVLRSPATNPRLATFVPRVVSASNRAEKAKSGAVMREMAIEMLGQDAHLGLGEDAQMVAGQIVHAELAANEGAKTEAVFDGALL